MNLDELHKELIAAARSRPLADRVPHTFEKRVMAALREPPAPDEGEGWARGLWRAALACLALMLLLGALRLATPLPQSAFRRFVPGFRKHNARFDESRGRFLILLVNSWKVILATLVIFGTGVVTGGLLVSFSDRAWPRPAPQSAPPIRPRPFRQRPPPVLPARSAQFGLLPPPLRKDFVGRFDRELNLSPGQREDIRRIVTEGQQRTRNSGGSNGSQPARRSTPN